jgi:hypothetical protein
MNTTNYQQQAIEFLNATGTTFTASFKEYGYYFPDDKDCRDIFTCTLKNGKHKYRFTFGQSIAESTGNGDNKPTAYDVLATMEKYDIGSFENFCSEFGYDTDSRKAYKTYKSVMKEWENVEKLFTPEQLEMLQEIS